MKKLKISFASKIIAVLCVVFAANAFAQTKIPLNVEQEKAVREIIRNYILDNPNLILEAMDNLKKNIENEQADVIKKAVIDFKKDLKNKKNLSVVANPNGKTMVVEFVDYNCGYCRFMYKTLNTITQENKDVKWVIKEVSLLEPITSTLAAKASIASMMQGKLASFHTNLMTHKGGLSEEIIFDYAKKSGLDIERLKKDMESKAVSKAIADNIESARKLMFSGVPAYIIGDKVFGGALMEKEFREAIKEAQSKE